ncbi:MAG: PQQ-binding-like beta-propeller repeat protein [Bacteroidota bacterium]
MKNLLLILIAGLAWSCTGNHPKIHEWRGENRDGIYDEANLLKEWPEDGPEEIWYLEGIGNGFGSPVVADDRLYITGAMDSTAILSCIGLDGISIWQTPFGLEWVSNFPGSRSAPTLVDDLIYVGSGRGNIYCMEKQSGQVVWSKDFQEDFQGIPTAFGHSESPAVEGDRVFWTPGGELHNVVAMNRFTGEWIWSNPGFSERASYSSPRIIALPGRHVLLTTSAYHLMGFDTRTGEMLWSHEQDNYPVEKREPMQGDTHANTPLFEDGFIYYANGDGNCAVKLKLSEDGSEIREVWRNSAFDCYMGGIIKVGNTIYGSGIAKPGLRALDVNTGLLTDSLKAGRGAIIEADGMIYYYNWKGEMKLIRTQEGRMEEVSSFDIERGGKEHFSHPVIHHGVLYQRHGDVLMAFDISDQ